MVKPQNEHAAEQRINAAAEKIMALDSDLRQLSWTRIREIAVELVASDLSTADRLEYARELDSIAATNLALIQRQQVLSAMEEGEGEADAALDEHAAQQARVASASAAVLSQIQTNAVPAGAGKAQGAEGVARSVASAPVGAASGFSHPEFPEVPDLADSDSSAGLAQRVSRKLDSLMDAVGLGQDGEDERRGADAVPIADADAGEAPDLKAASSEAEASDPDAPGASQAAEAAVPAEDGNYDDKGRWRGSTAPMNVVQMLNAEMVYQSEDEDDKDRYAAAAAQASLYDDPVAVILPSADELEGRIPQVPLPGKEDVLAESDEPAEREDRGTEPRKNIEPEESPDQEPAEAAVKAKTTKPTSAKADGAAAFKKDDAPAPRAKHSNAKHDDIDRLQIPEVKAPGAPGAGGTKPADPKPAEGEPSVSVGFSSHSRAERAILAERERKEAAKRKKKDAHKHRFPKIFGHKGGDDDLVVIPRGKAKEAPDDLFVSDRHRAAAEKRSETPKGKGKDKGTGKGKEKHSHTPGHAKKDGASAKAKPGDADDAEGHRAAPHGGKAKDAAKNEKADHARASSEYRAHEDGDQLDRHVAPATFQLFHTSRDGRVSFFCDAEGRITAVNSARLV